MSFFTISSTALVYSLKHKFVFFHGLTDFNIITLSLQYFIFLSLYFSLVSSGKVAAQNSTERQFPWKVLWSSQENICEEYLYASASISFTFTNQLKAIYFNWNERI